MTKPTISILGAGLVGSLLSLQLAKRGFLVKVYEKRGDPDKLGYVGGRSINLALSHRGIHALKQAELFEKIKGLLIPMQGRMMHDEEGKLTSQNYGDEGQHINSVSRSELNLLLIKQAREAGVTFCFEHECTSIDFELQTATFHSKGATLQENFQVLFGGDGAFSALRKQMELASLATGTVETMTYGYKELELPAAKGTFKMEPHYLHIWPRKSFMLIALPNPDGSFTCTLFLSLKGETSFENLNTDKEIKAFFEAYFTDIIDLIPDYLEQFKRNPTSTLVTIQSYPWATKSTLLIGDASHAIVPFYGQGMNAGFEDVRLLIEMMDKNPDWASLFNQFQQTRKPNADAISQLALANFIEMRDKVANTRFLEQKKLEKILHERYPDLWIPLYTQVTFSDIPYAQCLALGKLQQQYMDEIPDLSDLEKLDLDRLISDFSESRLAALKAFQ